MTQSIAIYVINSLLGIIIGLLVSKIKNINAKHQETVDEQKKQNDAIQEAVTALASDSFFRMCRHLIDQEEIDEDDFENLTRLYHAYKGLGLNGTGTKLYNQISQKPIRTNRR